MMKEEEKWNYVKALMDNATKQKVIESLNSQIANLKQALAEERARNQKNTEKTQVMQEQLNDLMGTLRTAQAA